VNLLCVIKDANMAEFASPAESLGNGEWRTLRYPLQAFTNAPWAQVRPDKPALPIKGMKFVVQGLDGAGAVTFEARNLCALTGKVRTTPVCRFGEGTFGPLVTPVAEPGVEVLGHIEGRTDGLLAARGQGTGLTLYCPVPYLPRAILRDVLQQAGVHRYDPDPDDILRADSRLIAIHTKAGGARHLSFPAAVTLREAVSGKVLGQGATLDLALPSNSTTILEMTDAK
jgi:hypothetical protein